MTTKKKLIRIEPVSGLYNSSPYSAKLSSGITFAFAGPTETEKDGIKHRAQVSGFFSCREQLCEVPRSHLHKYQCISNFDHSKNEVDMERFRLLIGVNGSHGFIGGEGDIKQRIFSGKRLLNLLEEDAGWQKSVITTVKHTVFTDEINNVFLLTGPKEWMSVPQLVSLATLILRLSYKMGAVEVDSLKDAFKVFKSWATTEGLGSDKIYIGETRKHLSAFLKNIDKIFIEKPERYYTDPKGKLPGWSGHGGIHTLFTCSTGFEDLEARMQKYVFNAKS